MGTDYDEFRKTCLCGKGTIRIGRSTPDHPWVSSYSVHWDANIECPSCQQDYVIDGSGQAMRVVRRADQSAVAARRSAYEAARKQFMASPAVDALKKNFAAHLDSLKSVAAVHRYLKQSRLESYEIGTFRKRWQGAHHWASDHVGVQSVRTIADLLGQNTPALATQLAQIGALDAAIGHAPTVMGKLTDMSTLP